MENKSLYKEEKAIYDMLRAINFDEIKRAIRKVTNENLTYGEIIWLMFHDWGLDLSV